MTNTRNKSDKGIANQASLFAILDEMDSKQHSAPGSLNFHFQLKEMMTEILKHIPLKRWEIAGRMSDLTGVAITEHHLNAWTAESKEGYRFPLEYLPAWCEVTGDYRVAELITKGCKCYLVKSEEVLLIEIAKIQEEKNRISKIEEAMQEKLKQLRGC